MSSDVEVGKLMLDREAWKSRISMIVKANKSCHSGRSKKILISLREITLGSTTYAST